MVNGLLERRLFDLAERYCRDQLSSSGMPDLQRAELTVELSRVFAERALHSAPGQRERHWKQAQDVISDYTQEVGDTPLAMLARRQAALVWLARGELARHEAAVVADSMPLLETARSELRAAVSELSRLDESLENELIAAAQNGAADPVLNADRLRFLQNDVRSQLARSLMNQALCYPPESADRVNSLNRAARQYKPLAEVDFPIDWNSRIGLLTCLRHLKDTANWQRLLRFYAAEAPAAVESELKLERAHFFLDQGRASTALDTLAKKPNLAPQIASRWDYARLLALMAMWKVEKDKTRAAALHKQTMRQVELLETNHGPYWMRRAEGLLARHVTDAPIDGDLAILARAAARFYRAGKLTDALATYERAWRHAKESGEQQQEFELAKKSGAVLQQLDRFDEASSRFREVAIGSPSHAEAPETHLLAIFSAAQALRKSAKPDVAGYIALLSEHIESWPESKTSQTASWWLARVFMSQKRWRDAIAALQTLDAQFESYAKAIDAMATCYRQQLESLDRSHKDFSITAERAAKGFETIAQQAAEDPSVSDAARAAILHAARFRLHFSQPNISDTEQTLANALAAHVDADDEWKTSARLLLVYALSAQPNKLDAARGQLADLAAASPTDLLDLVDGLAELIAAASPTARARLAQLSLHASNLLRDTRDKLSPEAQHRLDRAVGEALVAAGRRSEALAKYQQLSTDHPNDGRTQAAYAQLLLDGDDAKSWRAALSKWREVEKRSRRASPIWFRAKYAQALGHHKLGDAEQCAKIIKVTQTFYPELGGTKLKRQFVDLLHRSESK